MRKMRNAYKSLVGKPEERRPLERIGHRRKDNIKLIWRKSFEWVYTGLKRPGIMFGGGVT
jgi:hypothetical protein